MQTNPSKVNWGLHWWGELITWPWGVGHWLKPPWLLSAQSVCRLAPERNSKWRRFVLCSHQGTARHFSVGSQLQRPCSPPQKWGVQRQAAMLYHRTWSSRQCAPRRCGEAAFRFFTKFTDSDSILSLKLNLSLNTLKITPTTLYR